MKTILQFEFEDGGNIQIESDSSFSDRTTRRGPETVLVEKASQTFEAAISRIRPTAAALLNSFKELPGKPDAIEIEFGLKLAAEAGAIIAAASTEATFKVKLAWKAVA